MTRDFPVHLDQLVGRRLDKGFRQRVIRMGVEQGNSAQRGERPGARRLQLGQVGGGNVEQVEGPVANALVGRPGGCNAKRPQGSAIAVVRSAILQPAPIISHEIPKAVHVLVPAMLDEGRVAMLKQPRFGIAATKDGHHQRPGIVVDAIAMVAVGDRIDRVLHDSDGIAHPLHGIQRQRRGPGRNGARFDGASPVGQLKQRKLDHPRPEHCPAPFVGDAGQGVAQPLVVEQADDGIGQRRRIAGRHDNPVAVGQNLLGVNERRRDDRLSDGDRIAQRARRYLRHVEVGRYIDIARLEHVEQFFLLDEGIDELHIRFDAQLAGTGRQRFAKRFPLVTNQIGVGGADHGI